MIDLNKIYRTKEGREVRIYSVDAGGATPVHGASKDKKGRWRSHVWDKFGCVVPRNLAHVNNLVEVKKRLQYPLWINIYSDTDQTSHHSLEQAEEERADGCVACVRVEIDCEEGEGLSNQNSSAPPEDVK